jgi:hypothetical protein
LISSLRFSFNNISDIFYQVLKMDPFIISLLIAVVVGIGVALLVVLLTINNSSTSEMSKVTIDCNNNPTPRNLTIPSTSPFLLQTNGLGAGAYSLIYYSDPEYNTVIGYTIGSTDENYIQLDIPSGTQGIQYVFLCDKVNVPLTVNTPSPVTINPYIPYIFTNGNIAQNMNIALTNLNGVPSTLGPISAGSSSAPNPPAGYNSYSATFS